MQGKLKYGNTIIPYHVIQTKRKKTIQIFIEKDRVEVRAPKSKDISEIKQLLKNRSRWIFISQLKLKERKTDIISSEDSLLYLGENIPYSIFTLQKTNEIILMKNIFEIHTKSKSISEKKIKKMYFDWLTLQYTPYIKKNLKLFSKILNVKPKGFQIKDLKSKWGSATVSGHIHLNLHLLKTPRKMIDYVILHELTHLKIKGHRHEFWVFLESFMPDFEQRKKWLDENHVEILRS